MSTKLSARVILGELSGDTSHVDFYVRAVSMSGSLFHPENAADGWAAYAEKIIQFTIGTERRQALLAECVSVHPRATIEEAAEDMYAAIHEYGGRIAKGADVPPAPSPLQVLGHDPMGDES
jgi:hypothetical protein